MDNNSFFSIDRKEVLPLQTFHSVAKLAVKLQNLLLS